MRGLARLLRALTGFVLACGIVLAVLAIGLSWRLAQGPLDVTPLARRLAARYAPEFTMSGLSLAWQAFEGGPRTLHLAAAGLRLHDALSAGQVAVALSLPRLLQGEATPSDVVIDGLRLDLVRDPAGAVALAGPVPSALSGSGPGVRRDSDDTLPSVLAALQHVAIHDATVTLTDTATARTATIGNATADLRRRPGGGIGGQAEASITLDDVTVRATLAAEQDSTATTRLRAELSPVSPASLAHLHPALAPLGMVDAPLSLHAQATLSPTLSLQHGAIQARLGPGTALLPAKGGGTVPGRFAAIVLDADGDLSHVDIHTLQLVLAPPSGAPPTQIDASGTLLRKPGGGVHADVTVGVDRLALADLPSLWPVGTGGGARPWLTENLVAGSVHDGRFTLALDAAASLDDLDLVQAGGTMAGEDITMYWLRPVPPIEHGQAVLTLESPDALSVVFSGARSGRIVERAGNIRITGMMTPHQFGLVNTDLAAPVADVIKLLSHPKLNILSTHPLPLTDARGDIVTHLKVNIPLEDKVEFDDVSIHAVGQITRLHFGLTPGRDLDGGTVAMDVTGDGLKAHGTAQLVGIPSTIAVDMDFRDGPPAQVTQQVTVALRANERQLAKAGLDTMKLLSGPVAANVAYVEQRSGQATVQFHADIGESAVHTPVGWSKAAGAPGSIDAYARLLHGQLTGVDRLQAEAPGLSIQAHSQMEPGRPATLHIERAVIGRTRASGQIQFAAPPGDALRIQLSGPVLDLTGLLDTSGGTGATAATGGGNAKTGPGQAFAVDLRFGQVIARKATIGPVTLVADGTTTRIARAQLTSGGTENLRASLVPNGTARHLDVTAGDLGLLLSAADVSTTLAGGRLTLRGDFEDGTADAPFTGLAELTEFRIRGAPAIGKVLQALTLYGLVDALRGPGLVFDRLTSPFRLTGSRLEVMDARAFSASLGLTAKGEIDQGRKTIAMEGTVVPAYALNTIPGRIPLVGRLFSPERGGGLFAATFGVHGALDDPKIGFNPLAALTPGVLRGVFRLFP